MAPYPKITSFPPLGQLTVISNTQDHLTITVVIEWNHARPEFPFELSLSLCAANTQLHESQWPITQLTRIYKDIPYILDGEDCQRAIYTCNLTRRNFDDLPQGPNPSAHFAFTFRFRVNDQAPWQWMSTSSNTSHGELILQQDFTPSMNESLVIKHIELADGWSITSLANEEHGSAAQTCLLQSHSPIPRMSGTILAPLPLASIKSASRSFSVVRLEPYWLGPRQGKGAFFHTGEDAIVTSFLLDDGLVVTFVVVGWIDDVYQVLQSDEEGRIVVAAQNDNADDKYYQVVVSAGLKFEDTISAAMYQVRQLVEGSAKLDALRNVTKEIASSLDLETSRKSTDKWLDSLAFCTWNALGQDLTETKILGALERLKENNINISTLLIDDNWQTLGPTEYDYSDPFYRGWSDMQANTTVAPEGLKGLITKIRSKYPDINDIGVWHALMGYWGGISPSGSIARDYQTTTVPALLMGNKPANITTIAADALHTFYNDFYEFLHSCGLTFVKTDVQHMLSTYQSSAARNSLISTYQSAWTAAHLQHFGGKAISCMSQTPQTLFHSLLQTSTPPVVHRNSDDFYPEIPASHPWHVWTNAHNAVFTRHLNVVLDWDMFQTDHEFSAYHAAARCVSGGPILITDVPGEHDVELIRQMVATAPSGRAVALRTKPGVTCDVFGLYTEESILKIRAETSCGAVLVAIFNTSEREVRGLLHVDGFAMHDQEVEEVLVRGHRTGDIFGPIALRRTSDLTAPDDTETRRLIHARLGVRGWDILTAYPTQRVERSGGKSIKFCVLGLLGKMSGAAAVTSSSVSTVDASITIQISLKALGTLGVWFDSTDNQGRVEFRVQGSTVDERFLKLTTLPEAMNDIPTSDIGGGSVDEADRSAHGSLPLPHVWEVDVEAFWQRERLHDTDGEDVAVEVVIG